MERQKFPRQVQARDCGLRCVEKQAQVGTLPTEKFNARLKSLKRSCEVSVIQVPTAPQEVWNLAQLLCDGESCQREEKRPEGVTLLYPFLRENGHFFVNHQGSRLPVSPICPGGKRRGFCSNALQHVRTRNRIVCVLQVNLEQRYSSRHEQPGRSAD